MKIILLNSCNRLALLFSLYFSCLFVGVFAGPSSPPCVLPYPNATSNDRPSVVFQESEVLVGFQLISRNLLVYYSDEHPLTLGINSVTIITATGKQNIFPFSFTKFNGTTPHCVSYPSVGSIFQASDLSGTDTATCTISKNCERPMPPSLFITDITNNPSSMSGDWQNYGLPIFPHQLCGVWKGASKTVNHQTTPPTVQIFPENDPTFTPNGWNLGSPDFNTTGLTNLGWGAVASWNIDQLGLLPYHSYRFQVLVHDGDQIHSGGDAGEACVNYVIPPPPSTTTGKFSTTSTTSSNTNSSNQNQSLIIGLVLGLGLGLAAILGAAMMVKKRKEIKKAIAEFKQKHPMLGKIFNNPLFTDKPFNNNLLFEAKNATALP